jgi:hypothetical protein
VGKGENHFRLQTSYIDWQKLLGGSAFLSPQPTNLYTSIYILIKCRLDKEIIVIHHELQLQVVISANLEGRVNKQL